LFVDNVSSWVLRKLKSIGDIPEIIECFVGLRYSCVVVKGRAGKSLGLALTPIEDIQGVQVKPAYVPKTESLLDLVASLNSLEKVLGIALLNALSAYLLHVIGYKGDIDIYKEGIFDVVTRMAKEPIVVVGNMMPLVNRLKEVGIKDITVIERNPCIRCGVAFSDIAASRVIPTARTLIVTGATLVNDTIDHILNLATDKAKVILVGPTAALHPEPAFKMGIHAIASLKPMNIDAVIQIIKLGGNRWDFTKYCKEYVVIPRS